MSEKIRVGTWVFPLIYEDVDDDLEMNRKP